MFSYHSIESIKQSLEADLNNASKLLAKNKLRLNINKNTVMLYGTQQRIGKTDQIWGC